MIGIRGAESDATCWDMSAHISGNMSACPHVLTHASMEQRSKWLVSEVPRMMSYVGTCQHILAHVGMSTCADTYWIADHVQMIGIIGAESDVTCWHMSAHIGMSTCADTCQHGGKVQMVGIRGAENDATSWHMSAHVGTYQHMSACPHVLTHASMQIRSKWFASEMPRVMLHVGTYRHISAHVGISTCADTCQHGDKAQMVGIRGAESYATCWQISAHVHMC